MFLSRDLCGLVFVKDGGSFLFASLVQGMIRLCQIVADGQHVNYRRFIKNGGAHSITNKEKIFEAIIRKFVFRQKPIIY